MNDQENRKVEGLDKGVGEAELYDLVHGRDVSHMKGTPNSFENYPNLVH